jgi:hypothetical protein
MANTPEHGVDDNAVSYERPRRPFHCWLSFRCRKWPGKPVEEVGFPAVPDRSTTAAICFLSHGFYCYAREVYGVGPEDYEVWYVDRVSRFYMRVKPFGKTEIEPDSKSLVFWWGRVHPEWTQRERDAGPWLRGESGYGVPDAPGPEWSPWAPGPEGDQGPCALPNADCGGGAGPPPKAAGSLFGTCQPPGAASRPAMPSSGRKSARARRRAAGQRPAAPGGDAEH